MTGTLNGGQRGLAGVAAMAAMPAIEKADKHRKLVRFLDSGDADGRTIDEIASIIGTSRSSVYSEFVKRRVPMIKGRPATYQKAPQPAPKTSRKSQAPPGEAWEIIQRFMATGGNGSGVQEIVAATGLPRTTVRDVLKAKGIIVPAPDEPQPPQLSRQEQVAQALAPAPAADRPEGQMVYLNQASDGTFIGLDLLTLTPWVLEPVRPL